MKKISLLIVLALLISFGGVYANWVYVQTTDVADEAVHMNLNLSSVSNEGSYGTYTVDISQATLTVVPAAGTTHDTALEIGGDIKITFAPATFAPETVKENGVASTVTFSRRNKPVNFNDGHGGGDQDILTLTHENDAHDIQWTKEGGVFTYTISAAELAEHIVLTTFTLDTKALYDAYNAVLPDATITLTVSDGQTSQQPVQAN